MEDRTRHPLLGLGVIAFAGVLAFFALDGPARSRRGLRLLGLWTYLAVITRSRPDMALALDAQRKGPNFDTVLPYWGAQAWAAREPVDGQAVATAG